MEELDATINSLNIDNEIKTEAKEAIVAGYFAALNQTLQSTIESQSKVTLNEKQKSVLEATIKDIESVVSNRDMTEEKKRQEISLLSSILLSSTLFSSTLLYSTLESGSLGTTSPGHSEHRLILDFSLLLPFFDSIFIHSP